MLNVLRSEQPIQRYRTPTIRVMDFRMIAVQWIAACVHGNRLDRVRNLKHSTVAI